MVRRRGEMAVQNGAVFRRALSATTRLHVHRGMCHREICRRPPKVCALFAWIGGEMMRGRRFEDENDGAGAGPGAGPG